MCPLLNAQTPKVLVQTCSSESPQILETEETGQAFRVLHVCLRQLHIILCKREEIYMHKKKIFEEIVTKFMRIY